MRWRFWVLGWLWAIVSVVFAGDARADQNFSAIHVCVRPPNVPATVEAWVFTNDSTSYTVRLPPKDFKKQVGELPIYVYDPYAPPDSVKLYPLKYSKLVCPPPPERPKPPEEQEKKEEKDKKTASPSGPRGPPPEDAEKKADPKKSDPDEPPPGVIRLTAPPPFQDVHSLPPKGGVTESWPTSVLPFKRPEPETSVLPTVKPCGGGVLPFKGVTCSKGESDSAVAKSGDPTKKGEEKTAFEKFAENIALGGGLLNLQLGEDIHAKDGNKYGVPGGKNPDGIKSATAQAVAGSVMVAAVVISAGGLQKKIYDALAKGRPILLRGGGQVAEDAAEKLIQDAIAKHGKHAVEDLAAALAKNGAIGEYSVMAKFTKGLGGNWQAHHILERWAVEKFNLGAADRVPAAILSQADHKAMTAILKQRTSNARTIEELWKGYQVAYKKYPEWLAIVRRYLGQ